MHFVMNESAKAQSIRERQLLIYFFLFFKSLALVGFLHSPLFFFFLPQTQEFVMLSPPQGDIQDETRLKESGQRQGQGRGQGRAQRK